jgi:predicted Rossmann fold nucleotide-binding protein DprA/Smf involved in DNA uptake
VFPQRTIHPDTQAVLLLCGTFPGGGGPEIQPLTLPEYSTLASWVARHRKRPADLLQASAELLPHGVPGLPEPDRVRALLSRGVQMATALQLWQRLGLWVISRAEECYPERLRRHLRFEAPALLYGAGDLNRLKLGGLAVVGSRNIDDECLSFTRRLAEHCAGQGVQIVSGGALGIDQAAIPAALGAGGGVLAVLADRLDRRAIERETQEAIRRGVLTLVTPYEPESGFSLFRAMNRIRHLYALADWGLVIRFTAGRGSTWAGALEQLGRNKPGVAWTPLFVRGSHNPEDGCRELQSRGAVPFPEEVVWKGTVQEVLSPTATAPEPLLGVAVAASTVTPVAPAPTVSDTDSCYTRCLPLLLEQLRQKPGNRQLPEIAGELGLLLGQLKKWLARAIEEGTVAKLVEGKRCVYVDASFKEQSNTTPGENG